MLTDRNELNTRKVWHKT